MHMDLPWSVVACGARFDWLDYPGPRATVAGLEFGLGTDQQWHAPSPVLSVSTVRRPFRSTSGLQVENGSETEPGHRWASGVGPMLPDWSSAEVTCQEEFVSIVLRATEDAFPSLGRQRLIIR
jgi:hypothetical protein